MESIIQAVKNYFQKREELRKQYEAQVEWERSIANSCVKVNKNEK